MKLFKSQYQKPDGRNWIQYDTEPFSLNTPLTPGTTRPSDWNPPTLRFNRHRNEWVTYAPSRNTRPFLPPAEFCPLCPSKTSDYPSEQPFFSATKNQDYRWAVFENIFPGLSQQGDGTGQCEVIVYSPEHNQTLATCDLTQIEGLVHVWQDRSKEVGALPGIAFVYLFENKGTEIGVTLHHPHGQLYALNHIPPIIQKEHSVAHSFFEKTGTCIVCDEVQSELKDTRRIIARTESIVAFVPEAARYPYEVHITTVEHRPLIEQLLEHEAKELALVLKQVLLKYDALFGFPMPYVMAHHQAPAKDPHCPYTHWHIELYPPYRTATKLKYLAGVESGTGFFINDTIPEEKAAELQALPLWQPELV
jgi:UDPglucose--hexose-1-phosphate uridylyltransferase